MADRTTTERLGLVGLDVADVPFGYNERVEFTQVNIDNNTLIDQFYGRMVGTTASINLYVSSAGSDSNPGTEAAPYATIQAALDSLPKVIRHLVTINVATGSFAGFSIRGFNFERIDNTTYAALKIKGTLRTFTPATGNATSTATGTTAGGAALATLMRSIDDFNQSLTTNDAKGKFIEVLTGTGSTGSTTIHPIISNTSSSFLIPQTSAPVASGSTYALRECGTVIDVMKNMPGGGNFFVDTTSNALIHVYSNRGSPNIASEVQFENLGFSHRSGQAIGYVAFIDSQPIKTSWARCSVVASSSINTGIVSYSPISMYQCALLTGGVHIFNTQTLSNSINRCFIVGSIAVEVNNSRVSLSQGYFTGTRGATVSTNGTLTLSSVQIDTCVHGIQTFGIDSAGTEPNYNTIYCAGTTMFNNCSSNAIALSGYSQFAIRDAVLCGGGLGGANTRAFLIHRGPRVQIASTTTLTGSTDISMDGTTYSFATLRAASPKVLSSSYGSFFWEDN